MVLASFHSEYGENNAFQPSKNYVTHKNGSHGRALTAVVRIRSVFWPMFVTVGPTKCDIYFFALKTNCFVCNMNESKQKLEN
jgi:hypothetical protein